LGSLRAVKNEWPVVDVHHHVGVSTTCTFVAEEVLIPWMDDGGIDVQVVFQVNQHACHRTPDWNPYLGNDYIAKVQRLFSDRVIGLARIDPWQQPPARYSYPPAMRGKPFDRISRNPALEECRRAILELGLWGVKMHPKEHGFPVNHSSVRTILKELVKLQDEAGRKLMILVHAAADSTYNTNEGLADVCKDFPELVFLMAHCGFPWGGKTLASTVGPLDNILFDLTTCPETATVAEVYERYGASRFVAGTDGPFGNTAIKNAIVTSTFKSAEEQALVFGGNILRRLGLAARKNSDGRFVLGATAAAAVA
jgi:predicted TIM-barrel fold metal-dependent hydrolase